MGGVTVAAGTSNALLLLLLLPPFCWCRCCCYDASYSGRVVGLTVAFALSALLALQVRYGPIYHLPVGGIWRLAVTASREVESPPSAVSGPPVTRNIITLDANFLQVTYLLACWASSACHSWINHARIHWVFHSRC